MPKIIFSFGNKKGLASSTSAITRTALIVLIVLLVAIASVGVLYVSSGFLAPSNCVGTTAPTGSQTVQISIVKGAGSNTGSSGYAPEAITLVLGVNNTVTWTNLDSAAHTVTSVSAPSACAGFNSGNMNGGAIYTHIFSVAGTYKYHCNYHSWMTGTITVES